MEILRILLKKELSIFKNRWLGTTRQALSALSLLMVGFLVVSGITWVFVERGRPLLYDLDGISPLFYLILFGVLLSEFFSMLQAGWSKFYLSPELTLLTSTPIPASLVFLSRFVMVACFSPFMLITLAISLLPPLIAIGILKSAPWYYHLFIVPVAYFLQVMSASVGISLLMISVRTLSAKRIVRIAIVLSSLLSILWLSILVLGPERMLTQLLDWTREAESVLAYLFPLADAVAALNRFLQGQVVTALAPLLRLSLSTGAVLVGSILISQKLYYQGYDKSQTVEVLNKKSVEQAIKENPTPFQGRLKGLILTEWKRAARNHEMVQGAFVLLAIAIISPLIVGGVAPSEEPWKSLIFLSYIAMVGFLAGGAVSILFIPVAAVLGGAESLKEQYWLLKVAPLKRGDFMWYYWLAMFLPGFLISSVILILINFAMGSSVSAIIFSLVIMGVIFGSFSVLKIAFNLAGYCEQEGASSPTGAVMRQILPFLYLITAFGILAIGKVYTHIGFLNSVHHWPQGLMLGISGVIFLALAIFTSYYGFRLGARCWEEMEM